MKISKATLLLIALQVTVRQIRLVKLQTINPHKNLFWLFHVLVILLFAKSEMKLYPKLGPATLLKIDYSTGVFQWNLRNF